jgi:flagellar M-ring protein FliF
VASLPPDRGLARNPNQLALIVGATLAMAAVVFAIWYLMLRTPMEAAFTALKPADASLIIDELKRQKTPYVLDDNGSTILVPRDQVNTVRVAILGGDLPLKGTVGFELFSKSDMGLTEFAQKINYQRALQGELARTLMSMSNIDSARVHITLPETGIFQDEHRPAKASVTVAPKVGAAIDGRTIVGIQRLVASAVEDLDAANVVVLDGAGKQLSAQAPEPAAEASSGAVETAYAEPIRRAAMQLVNDPAMRITVWAPPQAEAAMADGNQVGPENGQRSYPLRIVIALTGGPAPGLDAKLVPLLQESIGFDPTLGDTLTLLRLAPPAPQAVEEPVASVTGLPQPVAEPIPGTAGIAWLWGIVAALALVALAVLLATRVRARRGMTAAQRASFSARLRDLLDAEELHHGRA